MRMFNIIALLLVLLVSCQNEKVDVPVVEVPKGSVSLLNSYNLNILEPSGLSFGPEGSTLLIVSDNTSKVYETTLEGEVERVLNYTGEDLEGVVYNFDENQVAVVEERLSEIVILDYPQGNEIARYHVNVSSGTDNKGLEGLSYNTNNKAYYILNEDLPGAMVVWNTTFNIIDQTELDFADDYSAIFIDTKNALIWIVSDESQTLYKCDYKADVLQEFLLPSTKYEGIAIDINNMLLYLVNDGSANLDIFKINS